MAKTFEERLGEALRLNEPPAQLYMEMEARLDRIASFLQAQIDSSRTRAQVAIEPGHLVSAGQQFNVVIHIPTRNGYRDTLFRAYVPASGKPVTLDFIGDEPELVNTAAELEQSVIRFLSRDPIRNMIRTLREIATKAPAPTPP